VIQIRLLEKPPVRNRSRILVTFLAPEPAAPEDRALTLKDLKGMWGDLDIRLEEIQAGRYRISEDVP
jgi:hypothetical protein